MNPHQIPDAVLDVWPFKVWSVLTFPAAPPAGCGLTTAAGHPCLGKVTHVAHNALDETWFGLCMPHYVETRTAATHPDNPGLGQVTDDVAWARDEDGAVVKITRGPRLEGTINETQVWPGAD